MFTIIGFILKLFCGNDRKLLVLTCRELSLTNIQMMQAWLKISSWI